MEENKHVTADAPISVYEVHLGSWRRDPNDPARLLSYRKLALPLTEYVKEMGFTHVEFLPLMEHPFYGSWDYQTTGYFAPSSRYGNCQDLMALIDTLHQNGIGVFLDWVPSHFPTDEHGLAYFGNDCVHRRYHQDKLSFSIWYAFAENFTLPLSHDEVVYGKGSLHNKMPGDLWQKRANLRLMLGYMFTHPGKKLLFMGSEFGQLHEWAHDQGLDWHLLDDSPHERLHQWVQALNRLYRGEPALHTLDFDGRGFEWIDYHDAEKSVVSYLRKDDSGDPLLAVVCNFTPVPRNNYLIGVPEEGFWQEILNSDAQEYGGSGQGNMGGVEASPASFYGRYDFSLSVTLPPLGILVFKHAGDHCSVDEEGTRE